MIYILSPNTYKELSVIDNNVNVETVEPILKKSQGNVRRIMGRELYDEILEKIDLGTLSVNEQDLLDDYVIDYLVSLNDYNVVPFLNYKLTNISLSKKSSENSTTSDLAEVKWLREHVFKSEVMIIEKELIDYLNDSVDIFPLFKESRYYECGDAFLGSERGSIYFPPD